jgi:opacity protein-like surface antigen
MSTKADAAATNTMRPSFLTSVRIIVATAIVLAAVVAPCRLTAQSQTDPARTESRGSRVGVQGFATAGLNWPAPTKSFEATGFERHQMELGGGVQATRLWRDLLVRVAASRISTEGERVFVNSAGESIRLGIPLTLKATYVDLTAGWASAPAGRAGVRHMLPYVGAGVGRVKYSERSPFAEPGDDFDATKTTYHVLAGVNSGLLPWLGVSIDGRYRWIPKLLGEGGASRALNENEFGGFDLTVGLNVGFWGRRRSPPPSVPPVDDARPHVQELFKTPDRPQAANSGLITSSAPVFLNPDATRTPLRTLEAGTPVRVLEESGDWVRIEFADNQWGPRVGYVERKNIRLPKQ